MGWRRNLKIINESKVHKVYKVESQSTNLKTPHGEMFPGVDLMGIEPVSLRVKGSMLTFYTTGPGPHIHYKTKRTLFQGFSLSTHSVMPVI